LQVSNLIELSIKEGEAGSIAPFQHFPNLRYFGAKLSLCYSDD